MPCAHMAIATAVAAVAIFAHPAGARSLRLDDHHVHGGVQLGAGNIQARINTGIELELSNMHIRSASAGKTAAFFQLANASIGGHEVACINCNTDMFARWVSQSRGFRQAGCKESAHASGSKHPNSPGYKEWAKKNALSFLGREEVPCNFSHFNISDIQLSVIRDWDLEALRPRLQSLWAQRRLVVGYGMNPLHQQMDFGEALMSLARNAPLLTPAECERGEVSECNSLFSGMRKTASLPALNSSLAHFFGEKFLAEHSYRKEWNTTEQRRHIQLVLTELKKNYFFYYQKCLSHEHDTSDCNVQADSELLGQVACQDKDDEVSDDCVYAELRFCSDCKSASTFFEYSRFHGPLALFDTKSNRKSVMGQCEEFSRAGHALLALLGYEARYVLDFTDHVWVEVRIPKGKDGTWVHADPSEGVMDNPLMYEKGWGKQLTMIFAFTPWSVEHVTAKYTANYAATVARRGISDDRLNTILDEVNHRLQYELPLNSWGYQLHKNSKDMSLRDVALWAHFEGA